VRTFVAELHIHTVLSACAEIEMIPPLIVQEALEAGVDCIAITDHNASGNVAAVQEAAEGTGLTVLPGMELQTREEVHVLCLFDTLAQIEAWQSIVDARLPDRENEPEIFGDQLIVTAEGDFLRREARLLATSVDISFDEAVGRVRESGGLAIPAHVDRKVDSLIANLGFVPPGLEVEALSISSLITPDEARERFPQIARFPLIQSGDAHRLDEIVGANVFVVERPSIDELRMALQGRKGRSVRIRGKDR